MMIYHIIGLIIVLRLCPEIMYERNMESEGSRNRERWEVMALGSERQWTVWHWESTIDWGPCQHNISPPTQ